MAKPTPEQLLDRIEKLEQRIDGESEPSGNGRGRFDRALRHDIREYLDELAEKRDKQRARWMWMGGPAALALALTAVWFVTESSARSAAEAAASEASKGIHTTLAENALDAASRTRQALDKVREAEAAVSKAKVATEAAKREAEEAGGRAAAAETRVVTLESQAKKARTEAAGAAKEAGQYRMNAGRAQREAKKLEEESRALRDSAASLFGDLEAGKNSLDAIVTAVLKTTQFKEIGDSVDARARAIAAPVGSIVAWPHNQELPGWAICNGRGFDPEWDVEVLRQRLDPSIYGMDKLPDYRGYFLRAADRNSRAVGTRHGDPEHLSQIEPLDEMQINDLERQGPEKERASMIDLLVPRNVDRYGARFHPDRVTPNIAVHWIIKVR